MRLLTGLTGCFRSALAELSAGYARSWSGDDNGIAMRFAAGVGNSGSGAGTQLAVRAGDESSEVALGVHAFKFVETGRRSGLFLRTAVNLL